jgi:hypothetical protein
MYTYCIDVTANTKQAKLARRSDKHIQSTADSFRNDGQKWQTQTTHPKIHETEKASFPLFSVFIGFLRIYNWLLRMLH